MKNLALVTSALLILMFLLIPHEMALSLGLTMEHHGIERMTYVTLHANLMHLMMNVYCLLSLSFLSGARVWQFVAAIVVAWTIPNAMLGSIPMLGISVANFALTGMVVMGSRRWLSLLLINLALMASTIFFSNVATLAHLYGFVVGATIGFFTKPRFDE